MVDNIFESIDIIGLMMKSWMDIFLALWPLLSWFIVPPIIWGSIKFFVKNWSYMEARMCGFGHRRAKKESAKAGLMVDLISTSSDLISSVKPTK